jgi:hypothetical protein
VILSRSSELTFPYQAIYIAVGRYPILARLLKLHRRLAYTLQILGVITEHMHLHAKSLSFYERALPIFQRSSGESYYKTNQIRLKIAKHYGRLQQVQSAL